MAEENQIIENQKKNWHQSVFRGRKANMLVAYLTCLSVIKDAPWWVVVSATLLTAGTILSQHVLDWYDKDEEK